MVCSGLTGGSNTTYHLWTYASKDNKSVKGVVTTDTVKVLDTSQSDYDTIKMYCAVAKDTTMDEVTFKPMLIDLDAQNLIPYPYARTTQTISGVTLTDNGDGSITVNGTATANVWYPISTHSASTIYATKGTYYLSGCPSGGSGNTYWLQCDVYNGTTQRAGFYDVGKGKTQDLSAYDITTLSINIHVNSGTTVNNLTFRPLLVNMDSISGYEPYGYKIPVANDTRENLMDEDTLLTQQGWVKQDDGSWYVSNADTPYNKVLYENTDGYTGQFYISCDYKILSDTISGRGAVALVQYTDGTKSEMYPPVSTDWYHYGLCTESNKVVSKILWTYGTKKQSTWIKDIQILKPAIADPETTNIYTTKQIMQGESMTFNEPFKLSEANQLSVETAVKPSAVKYTYYTY